MLISPHEIGRQREVLDAGATVVPRHEARDLVERDAAPRPDVVDAAGAPRAGEPERDVHHILDGHEVTALLPVGESSAAGEQPDDAVRAALVVEAPDHAGHLALVGLARA